MKTTMWSKVIPVILLNTFLVINSFAQKIPLVYDVENTGTKFPKPILPGIDKLTSIEPLTDPFEWSDGSGRSTKFKHWSHRRAEIGAEIEKYEIGEKPVRPKNIKASYADGTLTVNVTVNGNTLTLTSKITLPAGKGPFPAVIGMGGGTGSLPPDIFTSRGIATIAYNFGQVMAWGQKRGSEPINKLYPDLIDMGAYSAWSWGVSRLIDGLELVSKDLPIDSHHLAVTGCSFAGKMALFAGAFDERIALIIAQESGGGGVAAWRVSQSLPTKVETLGATSHVWFMESMFQFANAVPKLPYDHHELCAMIAPRALLVLGNPDYVWLADESGYVSSQAAREVWKTFGIEDRMGFSIVSGHPHCSLPKSQYPEVEAFVDKFLLGIKTANTIVMKSPFENVDYRRWFNWWGTKNPILPEPVVVEKKLWVGIWSTAPQLVEPGNMPPSPGLTNNSLRQVVRVSIGGDTLRVKFSNEFSTRPVTMNSVQIAVSTGSGAINATTIKELKFKGSSVATMNPGAAITSDPVSFNLKPRMDVAITIYFGETSATVTGHPGSRTTSYLLTGDQISSVDFSGSVNTDHWYVINGIDVKAPKTIAAIAIIGNSITDGRGSETNKQNRWPDILSERLLENSATQHVSVLNLGIGGNCVLKNCLGPSAVSRFERDILNQQGVRWAIIFEGVNDIGGVRNAADATSIANGLISAYTQMITSAHTKNIRVYGATIMPFKGNSYYNEYSELCRNQVNAWIRKSGNFDATIDFDRVMRNSLDTLKINSSFQNDGLHPDVAGHKTMGEAIDLNLFIGAGSNSPTH
jgi:lysophospholipase L1-like esterase